MTITINDTNNFQYTLNEDGLLSFSTISITATNTVTVTLQGTNGILNLGTTNNLTSLSGNGTNTITFQGSQADVNNALASLSFNPNQDYNGSTTLNISVNDGSTSANQGVSITINPINDAPVLTPTDNFSLTVNEDTLPVGSVGSLVSEFVGNISDVDAGALKGIAITSVSSNVTLYYSLDNGTTWQTATGITDSNALLLADTARIYVLNNTLNFNGNISNGITFRAWDQTTGTNGGFADTSTNGNETAFSTATDNIDITINPVNDAPTRIGDIDAPNLATLTEDQNANTINGDTIENIFGAKFSDIDGNGFGGIAVITNDASFFDGNWEWSNDGVNWTVIDRTGGGGGLTLENALLLNKNSRLRFVPNENFNGTPPGLTVRLVDNSITVVSGARVDLSDPNATGGITPYSDSNNEVKLTTSVTAVNDAPIKVSEDPITLPAINEDDPNPPSDTVFNIFSSQFDDSNDDYTSFGGSSKNNLAGIAIVRNNAVSSEGTWEWSNDGITWNTIDFDLADDNALVLSQDTLIRFNPAENYNGNVGGLIVRLIDDSNGAVTSGTILNFTTINSGGTTPYSDEFNTVELKTSVTPINDAPTRDVTKPDLILFVEEDTGPSGSATVEALFGAGFLDTADAQTGIGGISTANQFAGVAITANDATSGDGTWQYSTDNGTTWVNISTSLTASNALVLNKNTLIRFLVNTPNFDGDIGKLTARLLDNSSGEVTSGTTLNVSTSNGTEIYSNASNQVFLFGSVTPVNDAPTINPVALEVNEGGFGNFSNSGNFNLADIDNIDEQLIIKIASLPTKGTLTFNGRQVVVDSTFSADQIALLRYTHNGDQVLIDTDDSFNIIVEDGAGAIINSTIHLLIKPVNQAPSGQGQQTLYEGQTGVVVPINITDPDQAVNVAHEIKILTLPSQGTLKVNNVVISSIPSDGLEISSTDVITYDHNGNEPTGNDSFNIKIIDDGGGAGTPLTTTSTINLNIIPNNDDPFLNLNTGASLNDTTGREITITNTMLQVDDPDSSVSQLTYTVTDLPDNGYLLYNDNGTKKRLLVGATFTQQDINNGIISYRFFRSEAGTFTDDFKFQVRDSEITVTQFPPSLTLREGGIYDGTYNNGVWSGNTLQTITFNLTIDSTTPRGTGGGGVDDTFPERGPSQPPTIIQNGIGITNSPAILDEGSSITITNSLLKVTDPDNPPPQEIVFRIESLPTSGILRLNGNALRVLDSFTQKDIDDGLLTFEHNGDEDFLDNFKFTISDGSNVVTNNGNPFTFNFDVTPVNDRPTVGVNGKPFVREGESSGFDLNPSLSTYISLNDVDGSGEKSGIGFATINNLTFQVIDLPTHGYLQVDQGSGFIKITEANKGSIVITKAQLEGNLFRYVHDGTENFGDSFTIQANDNTGQVNALSTVTTVEIDIAPINDPPVFQQKKDLLVLEGGSGIIKGSNGILGDESRLFYSDDDNNTIQRQYVITNNVDHGTLFLNGRVLGVGSVFTQADLDNNRVSYLHDGSENHSDEFFFEVRDGAGGNVPGSYQIKATPRNDRPTLTVPGATFFLFDNNPLSITGIIPSDIDILNLTSSEVDRLRITLDPTLAGKTYANGVLNLATTTGITFINPTTGLPYADQNNTNNGGTNYGNKLIIEGTLADLQTALNTLTYQLNPNVNSDVNGTIELKITVDDRLYDPITGLVTAANGGVQNQNGSAFSDKENTVTGIVKIRSSNTNNAPQVTTSKNNSSFAFFINEDQTALLDGKGNNPLKIIIVDPDAFDNLIQVNLAVANGTISLDNTSLITGGANGTNNITLTGTISAINSALEKLSYTPPTDYNNYESPTSFPTNNPLTVTVNDFGNSGLGGPQTTTRDIYLIVKAVNDAPTRIDANPVTVNQSEDVTPTGDTVLTLFNPKFNDVKDNQSANNGSLANTLAGVAIVGVNNNNPSQGKWQWSVNGTSWNDINPALSLNNALLLSSTTLVRFLPNADFHGTPTAQLVTRLIDSSGGGVSTGSFINLSAPNATGGTTRYSDVNNEVVLQTVVTSVNDAPIATPGTVSIATITEDTTTPSGTQLLGLLNSQYSDIKDNQTINNGNTTSSNATPLTYVAIVGSTNYVAGQGTWQYSDGSGGWINIPVSGLSNSNALIIPSDREIRFLPAPNFFGNPGTLTVKLADGSSVLTTSANSSDLKDLTTNGGIGTTGSWSVDNVVIATNPITNVNDAPTINNPGTPVTLTAVDEDTTNPAGATVATLFASKYNDSIDNQQAITGGGKADTPFAGIAIVGNASTSDQGTWEYNIGGGWVALPGGLGDGNALLLAPSAQLRFVPSLNYYSNPLNLIQPPVGALTIRVADTFNASNNGTLQNITNFIGTKPDGSGVWSSDTTKLETAVNAVNDAPVLLGSVGSATIDEDAVSPVAVGTNLTGITDVEILLNQVTDVVTATVRITNFLAGDELAFDFGTTGITATNNGNGLYTLTGSTLNNILSVLQSTTYRSTSDNPTDIDANGVPQNPARVIEYQINDTQSSNNLSNIITTTVTFSSVLNDAPSLANTSFSIDEDPVTNNGQTINALFAGKFSDPDGPSAFLSGIAIIGNTADGATQGTWQYSTNGTNWFDVGTVGDNAQALALSKDTRIRFVPVLNYNGTPPALQVRALDNTYSDGFTSIDGSNNEVRVTVDTTNRGGTTAIALNPTNLGVTVNPVNDQPSISGTTGTRTYTENTSPIILVTDSGAVVDVDTNNFPGGRLTVSLNTYITGDILSINNQGTDSGQIGLSGNNVTFGGMTIGTVDSTNDGIGKNLVINFNANATKEAVQALLNNLTYSSASDDPTNAGANPTRNFSVRFNDGGNIGSGGALDSNILTGSINVIAVNDAPVNNVPSGVQTTPEDTDLIFNTANGNRISISDVDAGNKPVTVTLTATNGVIKLSGTSGLTFNSGTSNNSANINITGTITNINNALNGLRFTPTANYNNNFGTPGSITITTDDLGNTNNNGGTNLTDTDTITININPVNDAPVISLIGSPVTGTYTEGQTAFNIGQNIASIADVEIDQNEPNITDNFTATVTITNFFTGDELAFDITGTSVSIDNTQAGSGIYRVTGTKAEVLQVLKTTNYSSTSDNPTKYNDPTYLNRTITFRVNDNQPSNNLSNIVSTTVNITPVNDAPVVTASGGVTTFIEGNEARGFASTPVAVDGNLTLDDVDNLTLASAVVAITGNFQSGEDILAFTNNNGTLYGNISASYNSTTGELTLTSIGATATLEEWENALRAVTYSNSSDIPNSGDRTISITINDGQINSNTTTRTVKVVPVNDSPVLGSGSNTNYQENASPVAIAPTMTLVNADTDLLVYNNGSSLRINYTSAATSADQLSIAEINGITVVGNEVSYLGNTIGTFSGGTNGTNLIITFNGINSSATAVQNLLNSISYSNTSDDPIGGQRVFDIVINDNESNNNFETDTSSTIVNVIPLNDAPSFNGNATLASILEDQDPNTINGRTINELFNGLFVDADISTGPFLAGVAIVGNTTTIDGTWQYSTDNGTTWFNIGNVNDGGNALALSANTKVRFNPNTNYNSKETPVPPLIVRALDNTYSGGFTDGSTRVNINTIVNGGTTAIAGTTNTINTEVTAVNDAPTLTTPGTQTLGVGNSITFSAGNNNQIIIDDPFDILNDNSNNTFTVTLSVTKNGNPDGVLTINTGGITDNNSADHIVVLQGTREQINQALNGLVYTPSNSNSDESVILSINVNDNANGGTLIGGVGGAITVNGQVIINVSDRNEPANVINPLNVVATEDTPFYFTGANSISFDDPDDFGSPLEVTISLVRQNDSLSNQGNLSIDNSISGLTIIGGGNGTNTITLRGTEAVLNQALNTLTYQGIQNYNTLNSNNNRLKIVIDDLGNTGQPPVGSTTNLVTRYVDITVNPVNDAPRALNNVSITPVFQNNNNPPGVVISTLLQSQYDDTDDDQLANGGSNSTAFAGIAIVGNTNTIGGVWQYAISSSSTVWFNIPTGLSDSNALVLSRLSKIRFLPNADFQGSPPPLKVRLADSSSPLPLSANATDLKSLSIGPSNIWSNDIDISTNILEINTPPVINNLDADISNITPGGTTIIDQNAKATIFDRQGIKSGGVLTVSLAGVRDAIGDILFVRQTQGITISGTNISLNGTSIGTITNNGENGNPLAITFTRNLTSEECNILIQNIAFQANNQQGSRVISFTVTDGDTLATPNLASNTALAVVNVSTTPVNYNSPIEGDINGQVRSDILKGTNGNDILNGKGANDILYGYDGNDLMFGGDANDSLSAGNGNDILIGGHGIDLLNGDNGDDILYGGAGNDILNGAAGNDYFNSGLGRDTLTGGAGIDTYDYRDYQNSFFGTTTAPMYDRITDFNASEGDRIIAPRQINAMGAVTTISSLTEANIRNALSGSSNFSVTTAGRIRVGSSSNAPSFLVIESGHNSGFQANEDIIIEIATTGTIAFTSSTFNVDKVFI